MKNTFHLIVSLFLLQFLILNQAQGQIAIPDTVVTLDGFNAGLSIARPTAFKNKVYFFATYKENKVEFWETDGTPQGSKLIPVVPAPIGLPEILGKTVNHIFYAGATTSLSTYDGSAFSTLTNFVPSNSNPFVTVAESDEKLYFITENREYKFVLWESDGTNQGTKEIATDVDSKFLIVRDGYVYYLKVVTPFYFRLERYKNGTLTPIKYFSDYLPKILGKITSHVFFYVNNKMWRTDGTEAGTVQLNAEPGGGNYSFGDVMVYIKDKTLMGTNGFTFQTFSDSFFPSGYITPLGNRLIYSNGFFDITTGHVISHKMPLGFLLPVEDDRYAFYIKRDSAGTNHLCKFDFTNLTVNSIVRLGDGPSQINEAAALSSNNIIFFDDTRQLGIEPWRTDGTQDGTILLKNINSHPASTDIYGLTPIGNKLFFDLGVKRQNQFNTFFDLYSYNTDTKKVTFEHAFSPEGSNRIYFKGHLYFGQYNFLYQLNVTTGKKEIVFQSPEGYNIVSLKQAGDFLYTSAESESGYYHKNYITADGIIFNQFSVNNTQDFTLNSTLETRLGLYKFFQYGSQIDIWKINGPGSIALFNSVTTNATFNPTLKQGDDQHIILTIGYTPYHHWLVSSSTVKALPQTFYDYGFQILDNIIYTSQDGATDNTLSEYNVTTKNSRRLLTATDDAVMQAVHRNENNLYLISNYALLKLNLQTLDTVWIGKTNIKRLQQIELLNDNVFFSGSDKDGSTGMLYVLDTSTDEMVYLAANLSEANQKNFVLHNTSIFYPYTGQIFEIRHADFITDTENVDDLNFSVYPNPASSKLSIKQGEIFRNARIYNLSGHVVMNVQPDAFIDISILAPGLYILHLQQLNGKFKVTKFLKK